MYNNFNVLLDGIVPMKFFIHFFVHLPIDLSVNPTIRLSFHPSQVI